MKSRIIAFCFLIAMILSLCFGIAFGQTDNRSAQFTFWGKVGIDKGAVSVTPATASISIGSATSNKGIQLPGTTNVSTITSPADRLFIYESTADKVAYYTNGTWKYLIGNESDPIFVASPAHGITGTQITHWDAAYGWGDHHLAGYLTSESDPVWTAASTNYYTKTQSDGRFYPLSTNPAGYLTTYTETDPVFNASVAKNITSTNVSNWNTAFGWGNHASAGYLTSATAATTYVPLTRTVNSKALTSNINLVGSDIFTGLTTQYVRGDGSLATLPTIPTNVSAFTNDAGYITSAGLTGYTPNTRTISTTSPLQGGGDLSANRTLSILQSTTTQDGYLSSIDWNTFNNKISSQWITSGSDVYYDAGAVSVGINTPIPSTKLTVLSTTPGQLKVAYDASNFFTVSVASTGSTTLSTTGVSTRAIVLSQVTRLSGGFGTDATPINSNITVSAGTSISAGAGLTGSSIQLGGSSNLSFRTLFRGGTAGTPGVGESYGSVVLGSVSTNIAASGTHPVFANLAIKPLLTTTGAGTVGINATLYVEGAAAAVTGSPNNYSVYVGSGDSWFNGNLRFDYSANNSGIFGYSTAGNQIMSITRQASPVNASLAINSFAGFGIVVNNSSGAPTTNYALQISTAGLTALTSTTEQLRLGYDAANYTSFTVNSGGNLTINPASQLTVTANSLLNGAIFQNTTAASSNLYVTAAQSAVALTLANYQVNGANTAARIGMRGSTASTPAAGLNYSNLIIGNTSATIASSGTHYIFASEIIKPITVVSGTGTLTNNYSLFIEAGASGGINNGSLWIGDNMRADADIELSTIGKGIIIKSPDGTRWRLTPSNSGASVWTSL